MKLGNIFSKETLKSTVSSFGMKLNAVRPEILLTAGAFSVLGGTIIACTKTEKAKKAIEEHKQRIKTTKETVFEGDEKQQKFEKGKAFAQNYAHFAYELVKIYGVPALFWFGGMGMIFESHGELRKINKNLIADGVAVKKLFDEYRGRVAQAVGEENEQKLFMGAQVDTVNILEKDEKTGEEKIVKKKVDVFHAQPGSIFARNITEETTDLWDSRPFPDNLFCTRLNEINSKLECGMYRALNAIDIYRMLGLNENALTEKIDDEETMNMLLRYGISGNARKVPDKEQRKIKVTYLQGYQRKWDVVRNMEVYVPCTRVDFNFYCLEGKI